MLGLVALKAMAPELGAMDGTFPTSCCVDVTAARNFSTHSSSISTGEHEGYLLLYDRFFHVSLPSQKLLRIMQKRNKPKFLFSFMPAEL